METKIISENKNPFLHRDEIVVEITAEAAPSADEVKAAIGKDAELIVVKKINSNFGRKVFVAEAFVYENVEAKEKVEVVPQKVRKKMEADKKAAEEADKKAAEEKAKAEEVKEDPVEAAVEESTETKEDPVEEKKDGD